MSRLTFFSVRNRALIALATVFGILAGLWSASALPRELFPSLQFPVLVVATPVTGSSSSVVEEQVTRPIETAAQGLNNVVEVQSTSTDGFSSVIVELDYGTDMGAAQTDLQRVVLALPQLPDTANPQIIAGNLDDFPIIQMSASGGEDVDGEELVDRLERFVLPEIEDLDGVRSATLSGVADRVVTIDLDEEAAQEAGVSVADVGQLLQANGVVLPGGQVLDGDTELPVQVGSRLTSVEEIAELPLLTQATIGARTAAQQQQAAIGETEQAAQEAGEAAAADPTNPELAGQAAAAQAAAEQAAAAGDVEIPEIPTLGDVAEVSLQERPATAYTRTNGLASVGLAITKTPDGNAVEVSHAVNEALPELEQSLDGGELVTIFDQAPFIEKSIEDLATEGLLGLGFAVLVVLVFLLSVRLTLVTALSIPLSLLVTLVGLSALGYSLNILTLGALTIAIGRVVDDSIVVIENIKRHTSLGEGRKDAVLNGTKEVAGAITSATIATVAVFLPLGFVGGAVGELFRPFAVTVSLAMLASLLVALTIIPVVGFWLLGTGRRAKHAPESPQTEPEEDADSEAGEAVAVGGEDREEAMAGAPTRPAGDAPDRLQRGYLPALRASLRRPWLTLALAAGLLVATVLGAGLLRTDFIGDTGENTVQATLEMPVGTTLEETDEQAREVEDWLAERDEVQSYQATVGSSGGIEAVFTGAGASTATFAVTVDEEVSGRSFGQELTSHFEPDLPEGATLTASAGQAGPVGSGLSIRVQAQEPEDLQETAEAVTQLMRDTGAADVVNDLAETVPTLEVRVDRAAAAEVGVVEAQLGQLVQAATDGATVGQVEFGTEQLDIVVLQGAAEDVQALEELEVARDAEGEPVLLGEVAELVAGEDAASITRVDGLRAATVTGSSTGDDLSAVTSDLEARVAALDVPEGVQVEIGGVSADQEEAFAALGLALVAAVAIVYLVMVATFNSLLQPLILLVSVPFAATGSVAALLVTRQALDVTALVGFLMLIGIVVTNAIVLIDLVNQYRAQGMDRTTAVLEGARHRLRPILMTAFATILALVPMAIALTGGSAFISQPLAIVVIGGLLSSTLLTLILVPVLYELVERGVARFSRS
ncbi:efflux RND transporter permease subunit [Ornithinimicrobium sufpigmenti]|uniref:efflux RND transporter permease subunit n=1 Tax=Ornithinimicrobium sufpigmenti TaxID=2508882 RepID=UPI0010359227|nr:MULTISPECIES: efflux RND transporter permease subunit [unclassified Ornithinimicrobium]